MASRNWRDIQHLHRMAPARIQCPGPLSVARQVYSGINSTILFRGQGNDAFLGDAGNFAYSYFRDIELSELNDPALRFRFI